MSTMSREQLVGWLTNLLDRAGHGEQLVPPPPTPPAPPEDVTVVDDEENIYSAIEDEDDTGVLLTSNNTNVLFSQSEVPVIENGFAKGANPVKMIVTRGLTLNELAELAK